MAKALSAGSRPASRGRRRHKRTVTRSCTPQHRRHRRRRRRHRSRSFDSRDSRDYRDWRRVPAVVLKPRRKKRRLRNCTRDDSRARFSPRDSRLRSLSRPRSIACRSPSIDSQETIRWERGLRMGPADRYIFERELGKGAFSRVMGCRDTSSNCFVAVKVAKDNDRQRRHAESEADILKRLNDKGAADCHCPRLLDAFIFADRHFCLVFEPLDLSLHDLLQYSGEQGLLLADIQVIALQLMTCLCFVHSHGLAHTDIKCQNVMLRRGDFDLVPHPRASHPWQAPLLCRPFQIVLIDFGCATSPATHSRGRVGARQIRAPEVILGLTWDTIADLWSLGCVLTALYTGSRLFRIHDDMEHLAVIERILGIQIPVSMSSRCSERILQKGLTFEQDGRLAWPALAASEEAVERVAEQPTLREMVQNRHSLFLDLLMGLLEIQPHMRLTAEASLKTSFMTSSTIRE